MLCYFFIINLYCKFHRIIKNKKLICFLLYNNNFKIAQVRFINIIHKVTFVNY